MLSPRRRIAIALLVTVLWASPAAARDVAGGGAAGPAAAERPMAGTAVRAMAETAVRAAPSPRDRGATARDTVDQGSRDSRASPYLPTGHWAYPILDHWIATGRIEGLSPLVRPWRRLDVARAVRGLSGEGLAAFEREWIERLRGEFGPELRTLRAGYVRGDVSAGATYHSQTHRDPLRPELEGEFAADRVLERVFVNLEGRAGPVAGAFRGGRDRFFLNDPQFPDGRVVTFKAFPFFDEASIRTEEAYLELQSEYADLFFGRMNRSWGPAGSPGFTRSDYAYSYEEIGYRLGTDRIFLTGFLAPLRDFPGDTVRYFSAHRLEVRPWTNFAVAVSEAGIHGAEDGLDLRLVNPLSIWTLQGAEEEVGDKNMFGQLDLWWRPSGGLTLFGSLLFDSTNAFTSEREVDSCCEMGGTLGIELPALAPGWAIRARGSAVQSLTYRTSQAWEEWSVRGLGLGWDKADLYLATLEADWLGRGGLVLTPRLELQVRGEGDFRQLRPPASEFDTVPSILVGEAETTLRPALAGRWSPGPAQGWRLDLEWDLGLNLIRDYRHRAGDDRTEFVGRVRLSLLSPGVLLGLE